MGPRGFRVTPTGKNFSLTACLYVLKTFINIREIYKRYECGNLGIDDRSDNVVWL